MRVNLRSVKSQVISFACISLYCIKLKSKHERISFSKLKKKLLNISKFESLLMHFQIDKLGNRELSRYKQMLYNIYFISEKVIIS